jgi:O-antigen ligase
MQFTGGRQISVSSGASRLELWSEGLYLFKHSLGLGIGYHNYEDEVGQTAHNSFLLVGVETGILGLTLFIALWVICFTQLNRVARPVDGSAPDPVFAHEARSLEAALAAYLATSWFLSRVYHPIPYLLIGLVAALAFQVAERSPDVPLLPSWLVVVRNSLIIGPACLAVIYILVRLRAA